MVPTSGVYNANVNDGTFVPFGGRQKVSNPAGFKLVIHSAVGSRSVYRRFMLEFYCICLMFSLTMPRDCEMKSTVNISISMRSSKITGKRIGWSGSNNRPTGARRAIVPLDQNERRVRMGYRVRCRV
jgi:hypothetical protein